MNQIHEFNQTHSPDRSINQNIIINNNVTIGPDKQQYREAVDRKLQALKRFDDLDKNIFKLYTAVKADNVKRQTELDQLSNQQKECLKEIDTLVQGMDSMALYYANEKLDLTLMIEDEVKRHSALELELSQFLASNPKLVIKNGLGVPSCASSIVQEINKLSRDIENIELSYQQLDSTWKCKQSFLNDLIKEKKNIINLLIKKKQDKETSARNKKELDNMLDDLTIDNKEVSIKNNNNNRKPINLMTRSTINLSTNQKNNVPTPNGIDSFIKSINDEKEQQKGLSSSSSIPTKKNSTVSSINLGSNGSRPLSPNTSLTSGSPPPPSSPKEPIKTIQYPLTISIQDKEYHGVTYSLEMDTISTLRQKIYDYLIVESPSTIWNLDISSANNLSLRALSHTYFPSETRVFLKFIPYFSVKINQTNDHTLNPIIYVVPISNEQDFMTHITTIIDGYLEFFHQASQESIYFRNKMTFLLDNIQKERKQLDSDLKSYRTPQSRYMRVKSMAIPFNRPNQQLSSSLNLSKSQDNSKEINSNNNGSGQSSPNSWKSCSPSRASPIMNASLNNLSGLNNSSGSNGKDSLNTSINLQTCTIRIFITKDIIKTFLCHVQTSIGELIDIIYTKFSKFIQLFQKDQQHIQSIAEMKLKYVFKIRGMEIYLVNPSIPLSSIDFINTKSRRQKKIDLLIVERSSINEESLSFVDHSYSDFSLHIRDSIKFDEDEIEESNYPNLSFKVTRPFRIRVGGIKNVDREASQKSVYVACQMYQCGIKIGEEFCTPPIAFLTNPSWLKWIEGPHYNHIPSNAILCLQVRLYPSNTTIGWVNFRIWDYRGRINSGFHQTFLWMDSNPDHIGTFYQNRQNQTNDIDSPTLSFEIELSNPVIIYQPPIIIDDDLINNNINNNIDNNELSNKIKHDEDLQFQEMQLLTNIIEKDPLTDLTQEEMDLCWKHRNYCKFIPKSTSKVILSVPWNNPKCVNELYHLLHSWSPLEPVDTLELLSSKFLDRDVRKFAIKTLRRISDQELSLYLPQLVQALKHEPNHYSALAKFLLRRVLLNRQQMGNTFFWILKVEISNLNHDLHFEWIERYKLILEAYLRGSGNKMIEIYRQYEIYQTLKSLALGVKPIQSSKRKEYLVQAFQGIKLPSSFPLSINNEFKAKGIDIHSCKVMESKTLPLWLSFYNYDPLGDNILNIFKAGDDLRQDQLTLQMIDLMDKMWLAEGIDLQTIGYKCIATGLNEGMIEVVGEAMTIAEIQKLTGKNAAAAAFDETAIAVWLKQVNPSEFEYNAAVENFVRSCSACCVYTYILGIGDRHNDNIMLTKSGHLFHIDFGRFLGNVQTWKGIKRERSPFVFPPSFNHIIGEHFKTFDDLCGKAYNIIRKKSHVFLNLFLMMVSTGMPELNHRDDILYLRDALDLSLTSDQAATKFSQMIKESLNTKSTGLNFAIHIMAN